MENMNENTFNPQPGDVYDGTVKRIMTYGAFVEVAPGKEGLVHISKMAWHRIGSVEDVVKEGDVVKVYLEGIDDLGRLNLAIRNPADKPEDYVEERRERSSGRGDRRQSGSGGGRDFRSDDRGRRGGRSDLSGFKAEPGTAVDGTVKRLMTFGAFVEVEPGVEGLVHISKMAWHRVGSVEDVVQVGDVVKVYVTEIDDLGRLNLSMRNPADKPEGFVEESRGRSGERRSSGGSGGGRNFRNDDRGGRGGSYGGGRDRR